MTKKVLVVAMSLHGYGHIYRGELICNYLTLHGFDVTYISNKMVNGILGNHILLDALELNLDLIGSKITNKINHLLLKKKLKKEINNFEDIDIVIFENFPLGKLFLKDEFITLKRSLKQKCKFYCVFRDIFNDNDYKYLQEGATILNQYFDELLIASDPTFLPFPSNILEQIKIKKTYLGYIDEKSNSEITVFGGGGKFNHKFYQQTINVLKIDKFRHLSKTLYAGKFLKSFKELEESSVDSNINIESHKENLFDQLAKSNITISTFGYNTFPQLYRLNNYNIIVPLEKNREEQLQRAKQFMTLKDKVFIINLDKDFEINLHKCLIEIIDRQINFSGLSNLVKTINNHGITSE